MLNIQDVSVERKVTMCQQCNAAGKNSIVLWEFRAHIFNTNIIHAILLPQGSASFAQNCITVLPLLTCKFWVVKFITMKSSLTV